MLEKKKKDIIDFVIFEENTSLHYPWNLSSEQISERVDIIAALLPDDYTTDDIYDAVSQIAGTKNRPEKSGRFLFQKKIKHNAIKFVKKKGKKI